MWIVDGYKTFFELLITCCSKVIFNVYVLNQTGDNRQYTVHIQQAVAIYCNVAQHLHSVSDF